MTRAWYVVQTRAGQEKAVSRAIGSDDIEPFLPTFKRTVSVGRRREDVIRPLFPLYLFAAFDVGGSHWGAILRTPGVNTIIGINRRPGLPQKVYRNMPIANGQFSEMPPIPVPDYVVLALKEAAILGGGHVPIMEPTMQPLPRLVPRQVVRVIEGPFDGFVGLVDQDQKRRVWVLLDIMRSQRRISFPREALSLEQSAAQ